MYYLVPGFKTFLIKKKVIYVGNIIWQALWRINLNCINWILFMENRFVKIQKRYKRYKYKVQYKIWRQRKTKGNPFLENESME